MSSEQHRFQLIDDPKYRKGTSVYNLISAEPILPPEEENELQLTTPAVPPPQEPGLLDRARLRATVWYERQTDNTRRGLSLLGYGAIAIGSGYAKHVLEEKTGFHFLDRKEGVILQVAALAANTLSYYEAKARVEGWNKTANTLEKITRGLTVGARHRNITTAVLAGTTIESLAGDTFDHWWQEPPEKPYVPDAHPTPPPSPSPAPIETPREVQPPNPLETRLADPPAAPPQEHKLFIPHIRLPAVEEEVKPPPVEIHLPDVTHHHFSDLKSEPFDPVIKAPNGTHSSGSYLDPSLGEPTYDGHHLKQDENLERKLQSVIHDTNTPVSIDKHKVDELVQDGHNRWMRGDWNTYLHEENLTENDTSQRTDRYRIFHIANGTSGFETEKHDLLNLAERTGITVHNSDTALPQTNEINPNTQHHQSELDEPSIKSYLIPPTKSPTGVEVHGSLLDGEGLFYGEKQWLLDENGLKRIHELMKSLGYVHYVVDEQALKQEAQKGAWLWSQGNLSKGNNWDLFWFFNGSKDIDIKTLIDSNIVTLNP